MDSQLSKKKLQTSVVPNPIGCTKLGIESLDVTTGLSLSSAKVLEQP